MSKSTYLAIGPHCWGRGNNKEEAKRRMLANLPTFIKRNGLAYEVYRAHMDSRVDPAGRIAHPKTNPPVLIESGTIGGT